MSNLVAMVFDDEHTAFQMRAALGKMQKQYLIDMEDAVVVTKNAKGKVKLHQALSLTGMGALGGGFWGLLVGMLFLNPLLGFAIGAGTGAISGKLSDVGIDDDFMKQLGARFNPECSALFVLIRHATLDKVIAGISEFKGKGQVLQTSLSADTEKALQNALEIGA
jgi:uncharacterized membrane protein